MDTFVTILVISVFLAVLAYFKVPKVKEFVDSKVFRKKVEPSAPELDAFGYGPDKWTNVPPSKPAVEPSKPVLATTPLTPPKESTVGPVSKPQTPSNPPVSGVSAVHGSNFYSQVDISFNSPEETKWVQMDVLPDFGGRIKITLTEAPGSQAGDKPSYKMVLLDNNGVPVSPEIPMQYTGGSLTGATAAFKRFGDHFVVVPGVSYQVAVKVTTPVTALVRVTINGTAM